MSHRAQPIAATRQVLLDILPTSDFSPQTMFNQFIPCFDGEKWIRAKSITSDEKNKLSGGDKKWEAQLHESSPDVWALKQIIRYGVAAQAQNNALIERQKALIADIDAQIKLSISANSLAPFMTGTGMEHPLENGFAFIQPYGLPYLAGSSVKGVLRNTARLLAQDAFGKGSFGFNEATIECLFGSELTYSDAVFPDNFKRGALTFWDVIISPKLDINKKQSMAVDILTPHQGHYLQKDETPHDSGQPIPVPFLCVAAGAEFNFHITANPFLLEQAGLIECWHSMMQKCFDYTLDWFGFGAKTAVGYGILISAEKIKKRQEQAENQEKEEEENLKKQTSELIQALLEKKLNKDIADEICILEELERNNSRFNDLQIKYTAAEWIKQKMKDNSSWLETSSSNKQERKKYDRTQRVLRFLTAQKS